MSHSPEPWKTYSEGEAACGINDASGYSVVESCWGSPGIQELPNARRIVACVNLLAGIPTEDIEVWLSRPDSIHFCMGRANLAHLIRSRAESYLNHKAFLDSVADAHKEFRETTP